MLLGVLNVKKNFVPIILYAFLLIYWHSQCFSGCLTSLNVITLTTSVIDYYQLNNNENGLLVLFLKG